MNHSVQFDIEQDEMARRLLETNMLIAGFAYRTDAQNGKLVGIVDFDNSEDADHFSTEVLPVLITIIGQ